jgi:NitT/TauT family transport system permease protein
MSAARRSLEFAATLVVLVAAWWAYVVIFEVPAFLLPSPERVGRAAWTLIVDGELWPHLANTAGVVVAGLALGTIAGGAMGVVFAKLPALERWLGGAILFLQTAPKIALAPLFLIWFGLGLASKLVLVVSLVFFPVMVGTMVGLASVDRRLLDLARLLRLSPWLRLRRIELPAAAPSLFAGLKVGAVQAVVGAILAEWMSSRVGLGYLMVSASASYRAPLLFASILFTVVLGIAVYQAVAAVERAALGWRGP